MKAAQRVEAREWIRKEAGKGVGLPGIISSHALLEKKFSPASLTQKTLEDTKKSTGTPVRTITLRGSGIEGGRREGTLRRLSDAEYQSKKDKGLCFRCDEKYTWGHRCKGWEQRELRVLWLSEEGEEWEVQDQEPTSPTKMAELQTTMVEEEPTVAELSLNSVVGLDTPGTMKLRGTLKERDIIVLIDCGATHNFITNRLVLEAELEVSETGHYGVVMGTGKAIRGKGVCKNIQIKLGELVVIGDFLPLSLGGVDVILGMQWLHTLGVTVVDWRNLSMKITCEGREVILKGDARLSKSRVTLKNLIKTWGKEDLGFLVECRHLEGTGDN